MSLRFKLLEHFYQLEPDGMISTSCFFEIQQAFGDWCTDLEMEYADADEEAIDVVHEIQQMERDGILNLIFADENGDDYLCTVEFKGLRNPNQLQIPFPLN